MRTIKVGELEGQAKEILRQVENGETVEVRDGGKAVARLWQGWCRSYSRKQPTSLP